jgi:hypothetical protein
VVAGLNHDQFIFGRAVNQAVLVVNSPGPETRQIAAQWLGLAGTLERDPPRFLDQPQQAAPR